MPWWACVTCGANFFKAIDETAWHHGPHCDQHLNTPCPQLDGSYCDICKQAAKRVMRDLSILIEPLDEEGRLWRLYST